MQLFYTVRPGESLFQIAGRWSLPVESLIAANNLTQPAVLFVGQQLSVPPGVNTYRVQRGDTIFRISQLYGVPQAVIIEANELQAPYTIHPGQLLRIPPGAPYYTVQPGDTLFEIARRYNVVTKGHSQPERIQSVNNLQSAIIFPGMKLRIPYAPPGDHGLIAYTAEIGGTFDIWLLSLLNGRTIRLTVGAGDSFSIPTWSPDSTKIAFVGKNEILYSIHVPTGTIAKIDQLEKGKNFTLAWSHDSKTLAYVKHESIVLYNVFTHTAQTIRQPGVSDVQWFPNGKELLFQALDENGISQLFSMNIGGTEKRQITRNTNGPLHNVRLASNGLFALYTTPGVSISIINTVELSTGTVYEVKGGPLAKNYFPVWSPDSLKIAYSATALDDRGYYSYIRTAGQKGEADRTRAISSCFAAPVTWSPDSRKVAYLSGCNNEEAANEIWLIDLTHPVPIRLIKGGQISSIQWSPSRTVRLPKKTAKHAAYKVSFQYPAHWQKINDERYEGADGFVQISAVASRSDIDQVCHNEAFHQLKPYGSRPAIIKTRIQNERACFIFPSEDQPLEMRNQAAIIVSYPKAVQINGATYHYLIIWTDQSQLYEISSTIIFVQ